MATGVGPPGVQSDQGTRELGINDLNVVFDALVPVSVKYEFFGIQIGFEMSEIDGIRRQFPDSRQCLLRILRIRLGKTPALTWKDIDTALRSKSVNESGLAIDIQKEYGYLFIHEQTFESQEDGRKGSDKKSTKKGKYVGEDHPQQVGKERETDSDEEVSESEGFKKSSETPRTDNKSTKTQRKVKNQKKPLEPEKGSERERKQRGDKKKHADISPKSESKVVQKESRQKYKEISEQRAPKEVQMKYESEPSSGKHESKVIHKSKHKRKDSERRSQKCSEKKEVLFNSESITSSEEEIVRSKYESKVIHKRQDRLRKSDRKWSEKVAPKEVQAKSEISTKTQRRVKRAKKHSEPEQGNAKRERKAQMKQQARHEVKIESDVQHKDSHTGTCKEPKEVQSKSESEYSVSSSEEEMEEVGESETPEEYSSEQEQYSDKEEVSEDPTTSESKVTKETKGFVCPATEKQKKVINQHYIQTSDRGDRRKSGAQKRKLRKKQRAESEIRCNEIVTSSSHYGGKASQTVERTNPSKQIQGKEDERRETKTYKFKQRAQIIEEFSDEEVREKPATKSAKRKEHKKLKTKEKSSTNAGKEWNEDEKVARIKIIKTEYHLKTKEKVSLSPDAHVKEQKEKDKRKVHKQANETNEGNDLKADSRQELATRRKAKNTLPSDVTEEDSEGEEEWYSAESSEEENRDTEQNVSVEEEESEPCDDGITSSEEEVSEEHKPYTKEKVKETKRKVTRREMEKISVAELPGDCDPGERSEDQEEHSIKPKKRRRRHRECSPIARGSSSPSTSQEEQQVQKRKSKRKTDRERRKMVVKRKKKREKISSSSTTDDSSPKSELLGNLTESETKALVKVFKCFFGRLCCAIKYPVQTAAQLQAKHLISCSTMENIIKSPESQQVKAITLVRALDRKVKQRPDKIFTVTKVFLENEILQNVGRQLWTETGKICRDRTASMLGNELPSPERQLTVESVERHEMPGKALPPAIATPTCPLPDEAPVPVLIHSESEPAAESEMPMQTQSSLTAETSSGTSQGVSLSVPQSVGISPVLAKYKQYLQSVYNARVLASADKYLPTLEAPYINLAMIRKELYNTEQRDEFTRQTLHGGVDQILESKTPINIADLLSPEPIKEVGGAPVRFILVEGPPGIGKSTFAWEVCRRWDEIESLRHYHTVVLLKLREKRVLNAASLSDLFRYEYDPQLSKSVSKELAKTQGRNMLLLLDGFDEVSHSFPRNSVVKSILCRELLPECTIILTTRPVAKAALKSICQPRVDKHVEIIGFTEEERVRYITEVFSKEPELQVNFLKYMFPVPHIKSMMYFPLNCAVIAQVYYESQSSRYLTIPRTITQLYKALTHSLLVRDMRRRDSNHKYASLLPEGFDQENMDRFKTLVKFAFDSYHNSKSGKVTFFNEDIPEGLVHFGFMNESIEMYAGRGVERTFSFLSVSLQEYLAAWHMANSYSIEFQVAYHRLALVDTHVPESDRDPPMYKGDNSDEDTRILSLWQLGESLVEPAIFLAGITGWRCQSEDDRNHWEMYLSHDTAHVKNARVLLRSLFEAQNPDILPHYFTESSVKSRREVSIDSNTTISDSGVTQYDCYALSYCLAKASDNFDLSFSISDDNDVSLLETFVKGLNEQSISPRIIKKLKIELRSESVQISNRSLYWLKKAKCWNFLEEFRFFSMSNLSSDGYEFILQLSNIQSIAIHVPAKTTWEWLAALEFLSELKVLHITDSDNPEKYTQSGFRLSEAVLDIESSESSSSNVAVDMVLKSILRLNRFTKVSLSKVSRSTMAGVRSILLHCPSLTILELKRTKLGYDGILYICSALRNNTTLRHLTVNDIQLPCVKKKKYINCVSFSFMEIVPLPSKTTCTDFLLELNNILKDNTTLEEMYIQSGLFLPFSASAGGDGECCQWTGLGPLQQFNVGAVASGMSPNLRRSFSLSDLAQPQIWDRQPFWFCNTIQKGMDYEILIALRKEEGYKLFSGPSFTAPDTAVLQSFSGLDPRLKECLEISNKDKPMEIDPILSSSSSMEYQLYDHSSNRKSDLELELESSPEPEESVIYIGKACSYTSQSGISLHFPAAKCPTPIKVSVKVVNGEYTLPPEYEGMPLVSSMFKITASDTLPAPITVRMEHCAVVERDDSLVHMIAEGTQPYRFKKLPGGKFPVGQSYAEIKLEKFSTLTIICNLLGLYMDLSIFLFYHKNNTATFVATRNLSEVIEAIKKKFANAVETLEKSMIYYCYTMRAITLTIPDKRQIPEDELLGWSVVPTCKPPKIENVLIWNFETGKIPPSIHLKMEWTGKGSPKEEDIEIKLNGCSVESFTLSCMPHHKRMAQSQRQQISSGPDWVTPKVEQRALQKSNEIFIKGACPDNLVSVLFSNELLTPEERDRALLSALTDRQKLQEIYKAMERRVFVRCTDFHTLLQALRDEPATEGVAERMKDFYDEECRKKQV